MLTMNNLDLYNNIINKEVIIYLTFLGKDFMKELKPKY